MEKSKKMYVTAEEAAEMLGVSTGYAYKIIRGLNEELKVKGYRTICGKVPTKYFKEKFYGLTRNRVGKEIEFMAATRDGKMWCCQFYYKDWQGVSRKNNKRGFKTKSDAEQ